MASDLPSPSFRTGCPIGDMPSGLNVHEHARIVAGAVALPGDDEAVVAGGGHARIALNALRRRVDD